MEAARLKLGKRQRGKYPAAARQKALPAGRGVRMLAQN